MAGIVDAQGNPIVSQPKPLRARFDLAQTTDDNRRHWAHADSHSGRSALSPEVRKKLRERSRYEAVNSSWYAGILATATNHVIGTGPRLQVETGNADANSRLERAWRKWSKQIGLTSLLRVAFETYWRDGEAFLSRAARPSAWPVGLDVRAYEPEQIQSPYDVNVLGDPYVDDGIRFVPDIAEIEYFVLDHHPSDPHFSPSWKGQWVPARDMIHLFRPQRPGQVRGIPRATPGLPLLAVMRRFEMSTVLAAESAAQHALVMQTTAAGVDPAASPSDFASVEIARNMMTVLPEGWTMGQVKPEHPATTMEMAIRQMLMHFARCMGVPYGLAAGTSKDSNFSSHKGDVRNLWQPEVWAEQELLDRTVLDVILRWFLEDAVMIPGLLSGLPPIDDIDHSWFWDGIPPLDETDAANAAQVRLTTGQSTLPDEYAANGRDFRAAMARGDQAFGLPPGTYQQAVMSSLFPGGTAAAQPAATTAQATGEYTELGQRSFQNNQRRIRQVLEQFAAAEISETVARVTLQTIGLDQSRIDLLIADAADGSVDTPAEGASV